MSEAAVTVVVPTRNRRHLLAETVASVQAQTFPDWELVIVDDASEDDTPRWLGALADPRIRSIRMPGRAEKDRCRNVGLESAGADHILFLDDDDLLAPGALATHVRALDETPAAVASIGGYVVFDESAHRHVQQIVRRRAERRIWEDVLFGWSATGGQTLFRKEQLRAAGGWDESYVVGTDHELWLRVGRLGPVVLLPEIVLHYRVHAGQWRPRDLDQLLDDIRSRAIAGLEEPERESARRILELRHACRRAYHHYLRAEAGSALRLYAGALRRKPALLSSPLVRATILAPMVRCLAGSVGLRAFRPLVDAYRRRRRRGIRISGNLDVDSDGRWPGARS